MPGKHKQMRGFKPGSRSGDLFRKKQVEFAMIYAADHWPGVTISDGAFDVLRQVAEHEQRKVVQTKRKP